MKTAGLHLLAFIVAGTLAAQEPVAPVKTSGRLTEEIRVSLPKYAPPPPPPLLDQPHDIAPDPDLFALPKYTVKEKRPQRIEPNDLLTPRELNKKFAHEYKTSLKGLDAVLNSFTIPIFSASPADRGRKAFRARQFEDIHYVIELGKLTDPQNTALASDKTDLREALDRQDRPAGDGRAK